MRSNEKKQMVHNGTSHFYGTSFHHFIERENQMTSLDLASEFGLSLAEVRLLKKKLERS